MFRSIFTTINLFLDVSTARTFHAGLFEEIMKSLGSSDLVFMFNPLHRGHVQHRHWDESVKVLAPGDAPS